jgi:hypothetical protein
VPVLRRPTLVKGAIALAASLALAALSLALGIASASRDAAPMLAQRTWPVDARSRLDLGLATLGKQTVATPRALELARQAVRRDPTLPQAFVVFAMDKGRSRESRLRQLTYSRELSRRDLGTTLLLMQDELRQGKLAAALADIDIALRTSDRADEIFIPLLVKTTVDPKMVEELETVLVKGPPWGAEFVSAAVQSSPAPRNVADLALRLAKAGRPIPSSTEALLITRLVNSGAYQSAWQLYRLNFGQKAYSLIRNGDFAEQGGVTPFDWMLANEVDRWAARASAERAGDRLNFEVSGGAGGVVAKQVLMLVPGRYLLSTRAGEIENTTAIQPTLTVACTGGGEIARLKVLSVHSAVMTVPYQGCDAQVLGLVVEGDPSARQSTGWIDDVSISPVTR